MAFFFVCLLLYIDRGQTDGFTLKLKHGGWLKSTGMGYVGGVAELYKNMDIDLWGMIALRETVEDLGYNMLEKY